MTPPLLLASASEARARLLRRAGVSVQVLPARIDEEALRAGYAAEGLSPRDQADALAEQKARKVAMRHPTRLVLGCDQILALDDRILGKPGSLEEARGHLRLLSGQTHVLLSAVVFYENEVPVWRHVDTTRMTMRSLSDSFIDAYLERNGETITTSVGAYRIEEEGVRLFSRVEGDYFSIQGLPLIPLLSHLAQRGLIDT